MHVEAKTLSVDTASAAADQALASPKRFASGIASRRHDAAACPYRTPSVVKLNPGPLRKLAWVFGLR